MGPSSLRWVVSAPTAALAWEALRLALGRFLTLQIKIDPKAHPFIAKNGNEDPFEARFMGFVLRNSCIENSPVVKFND